MTTPNTGGFAALALDLPIEERIQNLCEKLIAIHGPGHTSQESGGKHLNIACPKCLEIYGRKELRSRHLAFNLDKYFRVGKWKPRLGARPPKGYAQCMKEHGAASLEELLGYTPISERGFPDVTLSRFVDRQEDTTYVDPLGRLVPKVPGNCIPVHRLPDDHPCSEYLRERDLDPMLLWSQFHASFCSEGRRELEHDQPGGIPLNEQHGRGWRNTAQGRLIFFSRMQGSDIAWQTRVVEKDGLYLHPYSSAWVEAEPIRYQTGKGSLRNRQLCGFEHVVNSISPGDPSPLCVITEGPLDAAMFPTRGMAVLGKFMSEEQALLIRLYFKRALLAFDAGSDKPGAKAHTQVKAQLESKGLVVRDFWEGSEYARDRGHDGKIDAAQLGYNWCAAQFNNTCHF